MSKVAKTTKKRREFPAALKSEILAELRKPDCIVPEVAKSYGVSSGLLYEWRRRYASESKELPRSGNSNNQFIEVLVQDAKNPVLQKASLVFDDFAFSIEGKFSSTSLVNILKVLEASC
jgi:transposase-like protein